MILILQIAESNRKFISSVQLKKILFPLRLVPYFASIFASCGTLMN